MDCTTLARLLKVLSDPNRLRIFDLLMRGTHCNCEVASQLGLSLSLVSHHLRVLTEAGLVQRHRGPGDARWVYYRVRPEAVDELSRATGGLLATGRVSDRQPTCPPRRRCR